MRLGLFTAITGVLLSIVFILFPQLDITTSSYFFNEQTNSFLSKQIPYIKIINDTVPIIVTMIASLSILGSIYAYITKRKDFLFLTVLCIVSLVIGPGLLVNEVFKNNWGRARPSQITQFSGAKDFTPAWQPSNQCDRNCSFVSGDASVGFWFFTPALLIRRKRYKALALTGAASLGIGIGVTRIVVGAHFLSDVILSGIICLGTAILLHRGLLWLWGHRTFRERRMVRVGEHLA